MLSPALSHEVVAVKSRQRKSLKPLPSMSPRMKKGSVDIFPSISEENADAVARIKGTTTKRRTSTTEMPSNGPRKNSFSPQTNKKPSFRSLGGKVTTLLRAKMAFQLKLKKKADDIDDIIEETTEELNFPKEPRFSTSMSPEAQYAIMKGYEDTVYTYLCKEYPEYRIFLKRNKTPVNHLDVNATESTPKELSADRQLKEISSEEFLTNKLAVRRNSTSVIPTSDNLLLKKQRSASLSMDFGGSSDKKRLPPVFPLEKQLLLTHRLQSAMDILDTLKEKTGMNFTSPRVKTKAGFIQPVSDYNKWTEAWSREFKPAPKPKG